MNVKSKLLHRLERLPGRTLLVITADHGESLGDVGYWFGHGSNIRHPCVNVPLIIACDGVVPIGVSDAVVANVDLAPTILALLGLSSEPLAANGVSLASTFHEPDPWPERMIPIQAYTGLRWRGVRSADFCLQSELDPRNGMRRTLLYDLRSDPNESTDVSADYPHVLKEHLELERAWFERVMATESHIRDDPEMMQRLRSLGYIK